MHNGESLGEKINNGENNINQRHGLAKYVALGCISAKSGARLKSGMVAPAWHKRQRI
jgi:hypothetical protein